MSIRILQVVTHMNRGGLETMLMNYYRHIDRTQIQFDFLTHRDFKADYDDEIESLGGKIYRLPRLVPWSRSYKQTLRDFFRAHPEYKIIHVHQDCLSGVICKVAQRCGVPVRIAHSHSSSQDKNLKYFIKLYYKRIIAKYSTHLLACGQKAGEWMFCGAPFVILNNAIAAEQYIYSPKRANEIRAKLNLSSRDLVIGHVGRFSYPKNHTFLIEIFNQIVSLSSETKLLLVGDGEKRSEIEAKIKEYGLTDKVILTGVRSDVPDLLQAMDVFVFPSLYEGVPVTMIEAQAAGLPCFISDMVPPECSVTDLVHTISLDESTESWAKKILDTRNYTERRNTYQEICDARYDIRKNAEWLQEYYWRVFYELDKKNDYAFEP